MITRTSYITKALMQCLHKLDYKMKVPGKKYEKNNSNSLAKTDKWLNG